MSEKPLRIAMLGTGSIASVYADALAKMSGVQIVALCNRHIEKAQAFNARHAGNHATCYDNFDRMLASEMIDAMWICLPPGAHQGEAESAANKGIHLMLEKPVALTMQRALSIQEAVEKAGVKCQIGHHMRHTPPVKKLKQMLDDSSAGRPLLMQGRFFTNSLFSSWWRNPQIGGGQLVEQSIHLYDLAAHLFGKPSVVTGFRDNLAHQRFEDYEVDDVSAATIRFENGSLANICSANQWEPGQGSIEITVVCEKVLVKFSLPDKAEFVYHEGLTTEEARQKKQEIRREIVQGPGHYAELCRNLIEAIRNDEPLVSGIRDGVQSLQMVLAVAESSRTNGQPQKM